MTSIAQLSVLVVIDGGDTVVEHKKPDTSEASSSDKARIIADGKSTGRVQIVSHSKPLSQPAPVVFDLT